MYWLIISHISILPSSEPVRFSKRTSMVSLYFLYYSGHTIHSLVCRISLVELC